MKYKVLDVFKVGKNTAVTLDAYGVGVDVQKPLVGDNGEMYTIAGVGMLAGEEPNRQYPLDLLIKGNFESKTADITIA